MVFNSLYIHFVSVACIFFLELPFSNGGNSMYEACSTLYSCGRIQNVGYPFWGGNRPVYCGVPDFKLNCLTGDEYPTLIVYNNGYLGLSVVEINASSNTVSVSRKKLLESCYMHDTSNITLLNSLNVDRSYRIITLFYGCSTCVSSYKYKSFTCSDSDDHTIHSVYYFENSTDISELGKSCLCKNNISVPVDERGFDGLQSRNSSLWNILTDWPVKLDYTVNVSACSECEESGGKCGSSVDNPFSAQFVCYCRDGPQPLVCRQSGRRRIIAIVGSGVAAVLGTMLLVSLVILVSRRRRKSNKLPFICSKRTEGDVNMSAFLESYESHTPKRYTYSEIRKMTNYFKDKLGEGGYGSVYKGILNDGRFVAVKKLKILQGDDGKEFFNEVLSISKTSHINVVTFLGFCFEGNKRALVFEFLPNGSLEKFIYGGESSQSLQWKTMFDIAVGIARGLDYLHNGCNTKILHFDIKPHNILLDEEFRPKISDFGLARLCQPKNSSMISMSKARGTIGYIAPEIFSRSFGSISQKSDVYSYGMMLLDLVCGKKKKTFDPKSNSGMYFPEWVYNQLEPLDEVMLEMMNDDTKILRRKMILVSVWCIQTYPSRRPLMNRVVEMLEGPLESLQMPPKPYIASPDRYVAECSPSSTM